MNQSYIGIQEAPMTAVMPATAQQNTTLIFGITIAAALLWGLKRVIVNRDHYLIICMTSGLCAIVLECFTIFFLKFLYPPVGIKALYWGFGKPVPIFMCLMYGTWFGLSAYILARSGNEWSTIRFWSGFLALVAAEAIMEIICIHFGLWLYYGTQPFVVAGFPFHVAVIVSSMSMVYGAIAKIWFRSIHGISQYLFILITPLLMVATFSAFTYPVALAIHSSGGLAVTRTGSLATIILCLLVTPICVRKSVTV